MNPRLAFLAFGLALATAAGCYTGSAVDTNRAPDRPTLEADGTDPVVEGDGGAKALPRTPKGIPCDVAAIFANACSSCHDGAKGALRRLLRYEDFTGPSASDPSKTVAALSLGRMKSTTQPMPPTGKLGDESIAVVEKWVKGGLPRGSCVEDRAEAGGAGSGATPDPEEPDAGPPPVSVCTSNDVQPTGPRSEWMAPGRACITCHSNPEDRGPELEVAGTVYPTLHEPDDCKGDSVTKVVIVDAVGNLHTMTTNLSGNFRRVTSFPRPYRALVVKGGNIRSMKTPQTNGDCNSCHSEWGSNGAPGRVMAP